MEEITRLASAIERCTVYIARALKKGDIPTIQKYAARQADFSTRLAILTAPKLEPVEEAALAGHDHVLTWDEEHVIFIEADDAALKALGRPYGHDGAERGALPLFTHIQMAEDLGLPLHAAEFKSAIVEGAAQ